MAVRTKRHDARGDAAAAAAAPGVDVEQDGVGGPHPDTVCRSSWLWLLPPHAPLSPTRLTSSFDGHFVPYIVGATALIVLIIR